jgi:hypothetical protein
MERDFCRSRKRRYNHGNGLHGEFSLNAAYDVFISYRRQDGSELAQLIRTALTRKGFRVFLDVRDLTAGHFDTALLKRIDQCKDFILLLSPGSLDRCNNEGDWLRREIKHAIELKKNLIPVTSSKFVFPAANQLPDDLSQLPRYQCCTYDHQFSDASISRLTSMLTSKPRAIKRSSLAVAILILCSLIAAASWYFLSRSESSQAHKRSDATVLPIALYWHAFGQRLEAGGWREFIVQDGSTLYSGDQFRLVFSPSQDCYAYVIALNADTTTSVLFPNEAIQTDNRVRGGVSYEIPDGINWFTLDESTGAETIYLLASHDPLTNLKQYMEADPAENAPNIRFARLEKEISNLQNSGAATADRTRDGKIVLRGIKIQSDQRTASTVLNNGQRVQRVMQFEKGGLNVVKRIRIYHEVRRLSWNR